MNEAQSFLISPQQSLGPFTLGLSINEAIALIQQRAPLFEKVQIIGYDQVTPVCIASAHLNFSLKFDPYSQRLNLIQISFKQPQSHLKYILQTKAEKQIELASDINYDVILTIMGPTFPSSVIEETKHIVLQYPGITFLFKYTMSQGQELETAISYATLEKVAIYAGNQLHQSIESHCPAPTIKVHPGQGIQILRAGEEGLTLRIGESNESALSLFKNPSKTFTKEEKESQQKKGMQEWTGQGAPDYFYNYFHLGLDVMIDGIHKTVKKIILHTNQPYHPNFGLYERCQFEMELNIGEMEKKSKFVEEETEEVKNLGEESDEEGIQECQTIRIVPTSDWKEITKQIKIEDYYDQALSYLKTSSSYKFKSNYYALRGVILEVGPGTSISSVTVFRSDN